jgi:signal peptidase II
MTLLILSIIGSFTLAVSGALLAERLTAAVPILGTFFSLNLSHNRGIAFSILLPSPLQEILVIAALILVCVIAFRSPINRMAAVAFGLIIGGALANLLNRAVFGWVTDYIAVGSFPIFNLADSAITVGAILIIVENLVIGWRKKPPMV